jgi:hypothetical protein
MAGWRGVEHEPASQGRALPENDAVSARRNRLRDESQLSPPGARTHDPGLMLGCAMVDVHPGTLGDRLELVEDHVEAVGERIGAGSDEGMAAAELSAFDSRQRDGDALARVGALNGAVVHLHAPHADLEPGRFGAQGVALAD